MRQIFFARCLFYLVKLFYGTKIFTLLNKIITKVYDL